MRTGRSSSSMTSRTLRSRSVSGGCACSRWRTSRAAAAVCWPPMKAFGQASTKKILRSRLIWGREVRAGDDADEAEGADAAGTHGGDLGVGGEAAEAEQDAGEDGGGNGDGEGVGEHVAEDAQGVGERGGVADQEVEDLVEVAHEEHEGEEDSAEQGVGGDFAEDVAGEDAHTSAEFECSVSIPPLAMRPPGVKERRFQL